MDSSQDKITTMQSAHYAVCKLPGRVVTPLVVKFYYAHGTHLARQTLANTFEQVLQVCLQVLSALLNRLNARILGISTRYSVAQYLAALRHKNNQLSPLIPVTEVQPTATLSTDCGRKQTRVRNLDWLEDHIRLNGAPKLFNVANHAPKQNLAWHTQVELKLTAIAILLPRKKQLSDNITLCKTAC
jgi:hypothetical protein